MKKISKIITTAILLIFTFVLVFSTVGCDGGDGDKKKKDPPPPKVTVTIKDLPETIASGETVTLKATVENADNTAVHWSVSNPEVLEIKDGNKLSVLKAPTALDVDVVITAVSIAAPTVAANKSIRVLAPKVDGKVGNLESAMLEKIGNKSITVSGRVRDIYQDLNQPANDLTNEYTTLVKMADGEWSGTWYANDVDGAPLSTPMTDVYYCGTEEVMNENFIRGKALCTMYIDKDNKVAEKNVTDYQSYPALWSDAHYYNHLASLGGYVDADHFTYNTEDPTRYIYRIDDKSTLEEQYLMAYLSFSLTPMLDGDDMFTTVVLTVEDGNITKFEGQTSAIYGGAQTDQNGNVVSYDTMAYTEVTLEFSEIGTTEVERPQPYTADEHADKLAAALEKMRTATGYTFSCADQQTSGGDYGYDDYEMSAAVAPSRAAGETPKKISFVPKDCTTTSGTVGSRGWVTQDGIIMSKTMMYSATLGDEGAYRTEYFGYRPFDGYYEEFKYDFGVKVDGVTVGGLKGTRRINGNMQERMPGFDFSENLFTCNVGSYGGKTRYIYTLRNASSTKDIAKELSAYSYVNDATASSSVPLTITLDENGNLITSVYPYAFDGNGGYTTGKCTTQYTAVNSTELDTAVIFGVYEERQYLDSWDKMTMKYYRANEGDDSHEENAQIANQSIFGDNYSHLPSPSVFIDLFDDNISGPFFDEKGEGETYKRFMSFTARSDKKDENSRVTNLEEIWTAARDRLEKLGYEDTVYTDLTGYYYSTEYKRFVRSDTWLVYDNGYITVVIENNGTQNFWIYLYNHGDYTRTINNAAA